MSNFKSNGHMNALSKKIAAFAILLVCALSFGDFSASAGIPSIPRKTTVKKRSSSRVVWGTEYDWLSRQYVTYSDIRYLDRGQVRVLKNSIYARHGYIFRDSALRAYFNSLYWYRGYRKSVPSKELNKVEQYNIEFLRRYE